MQTEPKNIDNDSNHLIAVIVILAIWIASLYNSLVKLRNNRENAFADIDVQLKQRHDLIPQLVETVKGYASHEKETLERVITPATERSAPKRSTTRSWLKTS